MLNTVSRDREILHAHMFCGIGVGARGFNLAQPRVGNVRGRFVCVGGIDVDAGAIANFETMTGCKGTVLDLFNREQFIAFHGKEPGPDWREATPPDIRRAYGRRRPDVVFLSAPCKGFSGLLSQKQSGTDKYQALNGLTLRGVWLLLEAYKDDPIPIVLFENVPRILTRGKWLLDQITALFRAAGYSVNLDTHDCGVIGNLAQSRKRALLIARHTERIPPFIYQPKHHALRGVGEVIGKLPLPGDPVAGPMHRVPSLQWKTWVRLAFVPAGKDWRALNELEVVDGSLRDFGIVPDVALRDNALGVNGWADTAPVISSQRAPGQGRFSVADPRDFESRHHGYLGVQDWGDAAGTVPSRAGPTNGAHSVADPRVDGHPKSVQLGVRGWEKPTGVVKSKMDAGQGPYSVADPRLHGKPRFNNTYRIVPFDAASPAVAGPGGPAGGVSVADPRHGDKDYTTTKYKVTPFDGVSRAVIGASTTGDGAFAVADPRPSWGEDRHRNIMRMTAFDEPAGTIPAGAHSITGGQPCVADPRLTSDAADEVEEIKLPEPTDRLVCRIVALDDTWHRPFTTLDLASLQSLFDPEEIFYQEAGSWRAVREFDLAQGSDVTKREWIGNAVPGAAATGMAETIGETILLAEKGETFMLSTREIWVKPGALALAVDNDQAAFELDRS